MKRGRESPKSSEEDEQETAAKKARLECCICFEPLLEPTALSCGCNAFCASCAALNADQACPICRRDPFITITFKTLDGMLWPMQCDPRDAIYDLKKTLARLLGTDKWHEDTMQFVHKGHVMGDDATMAGRKVKDGATIHVVLNLRKD